MSTPPMSKTTASHRKRTAAAQTGLRLGERLRQLRVAAGMTQTELAGDRFSKEYVSQIERGKTRPTRETIDWLAERLGVDAGFLANGVSDDQRGRVDAALSRAEALLEKGDDEGVLAEIDETRSAVLATGLRELEVRALSTEAHVTLGRALLEQDRLGDAAAEFAAAENAFDQLSSASHRAQAWVAQGDLAARRGQDRDAARLYRMAAEALQDVRF